MSGHGPGAPSARPDLRKSRRRRRRQKIQINEKRNDTPKNEIRPAILDTKSNQTPQEEESESEEGWLAWRILRAVNLLEGHRCKSKCIRSPMSTSALKARNRETKLSLVEAQLIFRASRERPRTQPCAWQNSEKDHRSKPALEVR